MNETPARKEIFNTNLNHAIGDQLESILSGINFAGLETSAGKSSRYAAFLGMVTILQFVEELTDEQAADATGAHMDWKYALHLPLYFPGLDPAVLSEFRRQLFADPQGLQVFQILLDRLAAESLLGSRGQRQPKALDVLDSVCSITRFAWLVDGINRAIEALACSHTEWLRMHALPHWFRRYREESAVRHIPHKYKEREELANHILADIFKLLEAVEQSGQPEIANLPEVIELRKMQRQQYGIGEGCPRWRVPGCALCTGSH